MRETPKNPRFASLLPTHSYTAAHLSARLGVPDLEVVPRSANDTLAVWRKRDCVHRALVPRQRAHLPIALNLDQINAKACVQPSPKSQKLVAPPGAFPKVAHLGARLGVPDLDELVPRPADDTLAVSRKRDRSHPVRMPRQRAHLPIALDSDQINAKTRVPPSHKSLKLFAPLQGWLTSAPVSEFQILTSLSSDPVAMRLRSFENATELISSECPVRVHTCQSRSIQTRSTPKHECNHRKNNAIHRAT